jgi:hypothetical protein
VAPGTLAPSGLPAASRRPSLGLVVLEPPDGTTTSEASIVISGLSQPNATITRDVPLWFDEHAIADGNGLWSFTEPLNIGENTFTFRVGDDTATAVTITVYYSPG